MATRKETKRRKIPQGAKPEDIPLNPVHCSGCGKFLAYEAIVKGVLRIKCRRCKDWTNIVLSEENKEAGS